MLVKTKLVSLNLYELIKEKIEEEEFVDLAETEKQLDKVLVPVQRRPKCMIIGALLDVHSFLLFFVKVKMFVHDYSLAWTKLLREQNGIKKATK